MKITAKVLMITAFLSLHLAYAVETPKQNPFTITKPLAAPANAKVPMPANFAMPTFVTLEKGSVEFKNQFIEIKIIKGKVQNGPQAIVIENGAIVTGSATTDFVSTTKGNVRYQLKSGSLMANLKDGSTLSINVMDPKMLPPGAPTANLQTIRVIQNKTITERKPLTID